MGSHFNVSWIWTGDNIRSVLKLVASFDKPVVHVCSGMSNIGDIRIDRTKITLTKGLEGRWKTPYLGSCNILGSMYELPLKSGMAGSVVCDPPYDYNFTKPELISELVRICKPRGKIVFIAPWIPNHKSITVLSTDLWNVGSNGAYDKIRTLFYKSNGQIGDYC